MNRQERRAWLEGFGEPPVTGSAIETAEQELNLGWRGDRPVRLIREDALGEGYAIRVSPEAVTLRGGESGLLYGAWELLKKQALGESVTDIDCQPRYALRMLNCWDNMDGSVERGYAGRSLWFEGSRFSYDPDRIRFLGRLLASCGVNVLCVNNVNVHEPAQGLIDEWLPEVSAFAALLRPFGVRLMLSVDFSQPLRRDLETADPLDERVRAWWRERADRVWEAVPDLAGFLVKADSENRPGPFAYGRDHAEGANMLAEAVAPHGGVLVWRAFVYNCKQDWRDSGTDRPKSAWETYKPLDGHFADNVILQVKYGPFDFQVREPLSPLLLGMPDTRLALEMQLAQEYTGQQIDLFAMPGLFREMLDAAGPERIMAWAAVSNLGRDENWFGHPFAGLNLYAFGRYGWDAGADPERVTAEWAALTYPRLPQNQREILCGLLNRSRSVYERYTATLGLCWMITPNTHYGPSPDGYEYQAWGTYHRASRDAVGIDRTSRGNGYTLQYPPELTRLYDDLATCPDELLLFFHRLPYDYVMRDGRTLIQRIYDDHFDGCAEAERMAETIASLSLPEKDLAEAVERARLQAQNAREWRDVVNSFFYRFSGAEDAHGRPLYI
ncbi:MAG: alpha-glucuronidase [Clostridia bacterium]|nr:alpha-glucuronidase [Clostridia bacterium]